MVSCVSVGIVSGRRYRVVVAVVSCSLVVDTCTSMENRIVVARRYGIDLQLVTSRV